ncbi:hypothetical protein ACGFX4_11930 [Kitasatospora sp. NPDC048365]|uniref:hypothetical protein n=1 Tax=Kitasatospora sp. NPDC048365 TaxID=3364050 RepID=UPI00372286DF
MDSTLARLVAELDSDSTETAEDAQHALIARGPTVLGAVIAATPRMAPFGQLCAIEVFNAFDDARPADVLIGLLESDSDTVRSWSAEALATLGIVRAVPAVRRAYERFRRHGDDPSYSEGVALRQALTDLGAREQVLPPRAAELLREVGDRTPAWPTVHLAEVVGELAAHRQAILYAQFWHVRSDGRLSWTKGPDLSWEVDRRVPWEQTVADCRDYALLVAQEADKAPDLVATLEWIDASDL